MTTRRPFIASLNQNRKAAGGAPNMNAFALSTSKGDADLFLTTEQVRWLMRELATRHPDYALAIADQLRDLTDPRNLHQVAESRGGEPR